MQKLLFPWSWAVSSSVQMFSPTCKLSETLLLGLNGAPSHRHDQLIIPSPAPLPSLKNAEWGFSTSSFSSWLDVSGDQSPSWSPPRVTSLEQQMLLVILIFRKSKASRSFMPETVCVCVILSSYREREGEGKKERERRNG